MLCLSSICLSNFNRLQILRKSKLNKIKVNFESENLIVDWISLNIANFRDSKVIGDRLFPYFNISIRMNNQSSKGYWNGSQIIFYGENADHFYKLRKTKKFNWDILKFDRYTLNLGRIDLCFSRPNDLNNTSKSFDDFLVNSRSHIQNNTNSRHIRLQDFPDGKILKVNRRNNSLHYRVYQKNERVRFELELKHRKTKLVQDYLFQNKLDVFKDLLVMEYFKYSEKVLRIDYQYTDWILDFQKRSRVCQLVNYTSSLLTTSYLESQIIEQQEEEEKFFHLLQFLSFVKSLRLNLLKDCKKHRIKKQNYYDF